MAMIVQSLLHPFMAGAERAINRMLAGGSEVRDELLGEDRTGGYYCLSDKSGVPLLVAGICDPLVAKRPKYLRLSQEKAHRLAHSYDMGHTRSYESRDPAQEKYGGALCGEQYIGSFSGFHEDLDEVVAGIGLYAGMDLSLARLRVLLETNKYVSMYGEGWLRKLAA